ncbi:hypothetical protein RI543_002213 [Arxiozyma heterogenica]|uniref:Uncharacterized protein n=1 Tax=Arxiozyma heterogenica TaxID=278026 RepID=A0AAN7W3L2_9SACH|nr:hypothetical protein RI543_002213 [Kazachstania heterogenica]
MLKYSLLTRSDIIVAPWKSSNQIQYLIQATAHMAVPILHPDTQVLPSELHTNLSQESNIKNKPISVLISHTCATTLDAA